ncbi:hypothetical protein Syun_029136 [Stephania yunnanensis]|uniref:BTB domain-containing protein n=1 Tax=Stephania yunnanensis TaxID=152371 RepID=A0AAP0HJ65_9MAGN
MGLPGFRHLRGTRGKNNVMLTKLPPLLLQMHFVPCFSLALRFIYTGSVDVTLDSALDLIRAADQYLLEGLKCLSEYIIAQVSSSYPRLFFQITPIISQE